MGFIDDLKGLFTQPEQKRPDFTVTSIPQYNNYSNISDSQSYLDQYEGWTYVATKIKGNAIVEYIPKLVQKRGSEIVELLPDQNDLLRDLIRFNDFNTYSQARFITSVHLDLVGSAFWLITESEDPTYKAEFYVINPQSVKIQTDKQGLPAYYIVRDGEGKEVRVELANMIQFSEGNPKEWLKGYSPLQASRYAHNSNEMIMKFNMNLVGNNGRPDTLFVVPGINAEGTQRLQSFFNQKFTGIKNAGKSAVINHELEAKQLGITPKDMEFDKLQDMTMKQVLAIHGVPLDLIGMGGSTFANSSEAQRYFQRYTVKPRLEQEVSVYNNQLIPKYYRNLNVDYFFQAQNPVEKDREADTKVTTELFANKIITLNEAREMVGLEPIDGGDEIEKVEPVVINDNNNDDDLKKLESKLAKLDHTIKSIPDVKEKIENARNELKSMYLEKDIESENEFLSVIMKYFSTQAERLINPIKGNKVNMKIGINSKLESELAIENFKSQYYKNAEKYNQIANDLTGADVQIAKTSFSALETSLERFANEFNQVTSDEINKLLAKAIENDWSMETTKQELLKIYDTYIDGRGNIDVLEKYGVYVERARIGTDGKVITASNNRYNAMLELISKNLTGENQEQALKGLLGVVDPYDPVGISVKNTIESIYGIKQPIIDAKRAERIVRTEINKIKNYITRKNYFENPFVEGYEWLSAHDQYTREAHARADGQVANKGVKFVVGGERLAYPGDPSGSAENVINCRCTIAPVVK